MRPRRSYAYNRDGKRRIRADVARCPYCLGRFHPPRIDARFCSPTCRKAAGAARAHACVADVPSICVRRETDARDRRAATGFGSLTSTEAYQADLRIRCLDLGEVAGEAQLSAAVQLLGSVAAVAAHLEVDVEELHAWGCDETAVLRSVAWSWAGELPSPTPAPSEATP